MFFEGLKVFSIIFVDIDECKLNQDGCMHKCTNTKGGFTCECNEFFKLTADNKTCEGI